MTSSTSIPLVMTTAGPVATSPSALQQALISGVEAINPDYTANLPGSLIEDIADTDVGALVMMDQSRVDAVNNVSPYLANAFILAQLGAQFGIKQGTPSNGSVDVVISDLTLSSNGYVISPGFTVSDGINQYIIQDGGIVQSNGQTEPMFAVSVSSGEFAIPANSVNQIITSVPSQYPLSVNNPIAGTASTSSESVQSYRARVIQAGQVASMGTPAYLKTLLQAITGVQPRLVSINQVTGGWQVICGGGDPFAVANAILQGVPDIATLQGSQLAITGMSNTNPVVITTNLNHGYIAGQTVTVTGATPNAYNLTYTIASVTATTITTTTNGASFGAYVSGAALSPNPRNIYVSVFQNPNIYNIPFVNPPQQVVTMSVVWNTTLPNFTAGASVNQLAAPALQSYLNSIYTGQPINLLEATATFQNAVSSVIDANNITTLQFSVTINGAAASPTAGTSIIPSDPESYFFCSSTGVTVAQG